MVKKLDRRHFLKSTGTITLGIGLMGKVTSTLWSAEIAPEIAKGAPERRKTGMAIWDAKPILLIDLPCSRPSIKPPPWA